MATYRNYEFEEKVNDAYKKVLEKDKKRIDEIKENNKKSFKWTKKINDAYKKIVEEK